jgi:hypothetical protein
MASSNKMMIVTSVPPQISRRIRGVEFGPAWQTACLNSWKAEGFHVVSLNAKEEVSALEQFAPVLDIVELPAGRQRPRIRDFLDVIARLNCEVAGIANADCFLIPGTRLGERLCRNLDGLVMAERLNISQLTMSPTGQHCFGFDAFFCNPKNLAFMDCDDKWLIGDTWWDYWFPLSFHLAGVKLKTLPAPLIAHLDHEQGWDAKAWEENGRYLIKFLCGHAEDLRDPYLVSAMRAQPDTVTDVHLLSCKIFHWLHAHEPLWQPEEGTAEDLVMRLYASLSVSPPREDQCPAQSGDYRDNQPGMPQPCGLQETAEPAKVKPSQTLWALTPSIFKGPLMRYRWIGKGAWDYFRAPEYRITRGSPFNDQWARKALLQSVISEFKSWAIVEMGAYRGETTEHLAGTGLQVFALESNLHACGFSRVRFWWRRNVRVLTGEMRPALKALLTGPLWVPHEASPLFYLHTQHGVDLPLTEVIDIIFCHCPSAILMIDGFEVPDDIGYGFVKFASGKVLNAAYIGPVAAAHDLAAFYPSAPSQSESGGKRGCVVLANAAMHEERLSSLLLLRK